MKNSLTIDNRVISQEHSPYVIAEISGNHNGKLENAIQLLELAKEAGADAVKIQTYTADTMTIDCDKKDFQIRDGLWKGRTLYELYQWAYTPWEWHEVLFKRGKELNIPVFSTPFDDTAVDFLEKFDVPAYKISSFEMTDLSLIRKVANTKRAMIVSTGLANAEEIGETLDVIRQTGVSDVALLHCISGYPSPIKEANLRTIPDMVERYNVPVGLSDHTLSSLTSVVAISLGACIIEKHITLSRDESGPDVAFSLTPTEFKSLCHDVHNAWQALGTVHYDIKDSEKQNQVYRRSLYTIKNIKKGEIFSHENIRIIRPAHGLEPKYLSEILGCRATQELAYGTALNWSMVE